MTLDEYLSTYCDPDNLHTILTNPSYEDWPTIVVRYEGFALVMHLGAIDGDGAHLFIDSHAFIDGEQVRVGVFGMEEGRQYELHGEWNPVADAPNLVGRSNGWPATSGVTMLVGEQE